MLFGCAKLMKAQQGRAAPIWITGTWLRSGSIATPVVLHKPRGGAWVVKYLGADVPSAGSATFSRGVRNPGDAAGVVSVDSVFTFDRGAAAGTYYEYNADRRWARSTDSGASWTYPGITSGSSTSLFSEESTPTPPGTVYDSPDIQKLPGATIFSPAPGVVCALGKERVGEDVTAGGVTYYTYDLILLRSDAGGPLAKVATIMPIVRHNTALDPTVTVAYFENEYRGIFSRPDPTPRAISTKSKPASPTNILAGIIAIDRKGGVSAPGGSQEVWYIYTDGSSVNYAAPPFDALYGSSGPPITAAAWDGENYYLATVDTTTNAQVMKRAATLGGSWSTVYSGGTSTFGGAAARAPGRLVFSGKGATQDGGSNWTATSTFSAIGWFGTAYYGIQGTSASRSFSGATWTSQTLPSVSGLFAFNDIFGG